MNGAWRYAHVAHQNEHVRLFHLRGSFSVSVPFASPGLLTYLGSRHLRKTQAVEALLDPDERGGVDRGSLFRFIKCMLPGVPTEHWAALSTISRKRFGGVARHKCPRARQQHHQR